MKTQNLYRIWANILPRLTSSLPAPFRMGSSASAVASCIFLPSLLPRGDTPGMAGGRFTMWRPSSGSSPAGKSPHPPLVPKRILESGSLAEVAWSTPHYPPAFSVSSLPFTHQEHAYFLKQSLGSKHFTSSFITFTVMMKLLLLLWLYIQKHGWWEENASRMLKRTRLSVRWMQAAKRQNTFPRKQPAWIQGALLVFVDMRVSPWGRFRGRQRSPPPISWKAEQLLPQHFFLNTDVTHLPHTASPNPLHQCPLAILSLILMHILPFWNQTLQCLTLRHSKFWTAPIKCNTEVFEKLIYTFITLDIIWVNKCTEKNTIQWLNRSAQDENLWQRSTRTVKLIYSATQGWSKIPAIIIKKEKKKS